MNHQINNLIKPYIHAGHLIGYKELLFIPAMIWNYRCVYCASRFSRFWNINRDHCLSRQNFDMTIETGPFIPRLINKPLYV